MMKIVISMFLSVLYGIPYDDFQIQKGIKLSFSIIKPQLTSIGKVAFDRALKVL